MSDYTQSTFFAPKDLLATGNPNKIIYGSDVDAELSAISTAIATKADVNGDAIGAGTPCTELSVDNLKLDGNKITSTNTDGDIELEPDGTGSVVITKVDIADGEIDGTPIGANSASTGAFTTLTVNGTGAVTQSSNAATALMTFTNSNAGASSRSSITFASDTGSSAVGTVSSGWTVDALSANETFLYGSNGVALFAPASQNVRILAGGSEKVRVTSAGNVGYNGKLFSSNDLTTLGGLQLYRDHATGSCYLFDTTAAPFSGPLIFGTNNAEAMRITSGGYFKASDAGVYVNNTGAFHELRGTGTAETLIVSNEVSASTAILAHTKGAANFAGVHFLAENTGTTVFQVAANGNVTNTNNSYGAISDIKIKENITDAAPKLEELNQVRVVNYNLIGSEQKQLGVVAQELEQVFPGMVDETPDRDADGNDLGTTTKSVKYSVFVPMLIKAMQEQQEIINDLRARVAALEA